MKNSGIEITRRELLMVGAASLAATAVPLLARGEVPATEAPVLSKLSFDVNGKACELETQRGRRGEERPVVPLCRAA